MAFTKLTQAQIDSRGATTLDNRPQIGATKLKEEFDAPAKKVIAPALNNLVDELNASTAAESVGFSATGMTATNVKAAIEEIGSSESAHASRTDNPHSVTQAQVGLSNVNNTSDLDKPVSTATQTELNKKVDKVDGKGLSTNDYDNTEKGNVASNTSARHTHSNKELLDTYTQSNSDIEDSVTKKHAHSNKALLDTYTQTESDIAEAVSKKHEHSNKNVIDKFGESSGQPTYDGNPIGGGTNDYNGLTNQPSINSVVLTGNKTLAALGIASASDVTTINAKLSNYEQSGYLSNNLCDTSKLEVGVAWGGASNTTRGRILVPFTSGAYSVSVSANAISQFAHVSVREIDAPTTNNSLWAYDFSASNLSVTHNLSSGAKYVAITFDVGSGNTFSASMIDGIKIQMNTGTTVTDYVPFSLPNTTMSHTLSDNVDWLKPIELLDLTLGTTTSNGITCTKDGNKYTLNGTATANTYFKLTSVSLDSTKTYRLMGGALGNQYTYMMYLYSASGGEFRDLGNGIIFTPNATTTFDLYLRVQNTVTVSNVIFNPTLTEYSESNVAITQRLSGITDELSDITTIKQGICTSNFTIGSMNKVTKIGNLCELVLIVTVDSATANSTPIFNIPSGFCPVEVIQDIVPVSSSGDATKGIQIEKNGTVKSMSNISSSTLFRIHLVYLSA